MSDFSPTEKTRLHQAPQRGHYDAATIHAILDEGLVAHVGFVDGGQPYVIPMNYARDGDRLLLHMSRTSRFFRVVAGGAPLCLTVTLIDGLVIGAAPAQHAMNYRSVVVLGQAQEITGDEQRRAALHRFNEFYLPGHATYCGPLTMEDLQAVAVLAVPLREASAKVRAAPPLSDEADREPRWCGEIPLRLAALPPVRAPQSPASLAPPPSVAQWTHPGILHVK